MLLLLGGSAATRDTETARESTPNPQRCDGHRHRVGAAGHLHGWRSVQRLAGQAWHPSRWRQARPVTRNERWRLGHRRRCSRPGHGPVARKVIERHRKRFRAHRAARLADERRRQELAALLPYDCGAYGRWAIPCAIVSCESGYSWSAYNPSGAAGPYQIMPMHGRPWPVRTAADRDAHHRIAAGLWRGGAGRSHWVC